MAEIEEIKSQIEQAKQITEQKKQEAAQLEAELAERERSMPNLTTQQALRQKYSGMQGRLARQQQAASLQEIQQQRGQIQQFRQNLQGYEQDISQAQSDVADYEERQAAIKNVEKAAAQGKAWLYAFHGNPYEQEYAKQYMKDAQMAKEAAKEQLRQQVSKWEAANPTEKLVVDYDNLNIKGVSSGSLAKSLPIDAYNKKVEEINKQIGTEKSWLPKSKKEVASDQLFAIAQKESLKPMPNTGPTTGMK